MQPDQPVPLLAAMRSLQSALDSYDRDAAEAMGVGRNDARALRFLAEKGPATPSALMVELGLTSGSVTALIDRLEREGFTKRRPKPDDRRSVVVELSERGMRALLDAVSPLNELAGKLTTRLPHERSGAVVKQLDDLTRLVDWAVRTGS